jgi:hypothetical protein
MSQFFVARDSASIQKFNLSQLSRRNHHGNALTLAGSLVAVTNTGIKVDGIAYLQSERFGAYRHIQVSREQIQQLHARMLMRPRFLQQGRFEFSIESVQLALCCVEVQTFKVVCDASSPRVVGKSQPFLLA